MKHAKISVESQVNIHTMWRGLDFDPVTGLIECLELADEKQKPVVYHWVGGNLGGVEVEKNFTVYPRK